MRSEKEYSVGDTSFLSLGLDVGTTTTHLVISQLTMGAGEDPFGRAHLLEKRILHRSPVYMTPMLDGDSIDGDRIRAIVDAEYAKAGVHADDIVTGAVIITGETARKQNAEAVVQQLAGESSRFAAAVAGANAEAILAGRGSGAADWSRRNAGITLNIDIGGGTTNLAWFDRGRVADAAAIRVGGRHLVRGPSVPRIWHVATTAARRSLGCEFADDGMAEQWMMICVRACAAAMAGRFADIPPELIVTQPHGIPPAPDVVFVSGGVGELMVRLRRGIALPPDLDDTGPMLARALLASPMPRSPAIEYPAEPIRATVIGAGQFAMSLSGETLWADPALLPLRNLPVLRPFRRLDEMADAAAIADAIDRQRRLHAVEPDHRVAVALPSLRTADWDAVVALAERLVAAAETLRLPGPWVIVMADNFGRLLGRSMADAAPARPIIVIDEVRADDADFIDIGQPLPRPQPVIPVITKTLVFE